MHVLCDKAQTMFKMIFLKHFDGSVLGPEQTLNQKKKFQFDSICSISGIAVATVHTYIFG